jgi:hypothetical protein
MSVKKLSKMKSWRSDPFKRILIEACTQKGSFNMKKMITGIIPQSALSLRKKMTGRFESEITGALPFRRREKRKCLFRKQKILMMKLIRAKIKRGKMRKEKRMMVRETEEKKRKSIAMRRGKRKSERIERERERRHRDKLDEE